MGGALVGAGIRLYGGRRARRRQLRAAQGVRVQKLDEGDEVVAIGRVMNEEV